MCGSRKYQYPSKAGIENSVEWWKGGQRPKKFSSDGAVFLLQKDLNAEKSGRVWLMCKPASHEPSEPMLASQQNFYCFFSFKFNVNVLPRKCYTWQNKQNFSIFFHTWNSPQVIFLSVVNLISWNWFCR